MCAFVRGLTWCGVQREDFCSFLPLRTNRSLLSFTACVQDGAGGGSVQQICLYQLPSVLSQGTAIYVPLAANLCGVCMLLAQREYFSDSVTWEVANEACVADGGSLASVLTAGQNAALRNFVLESDPEAQRLWLGGNDLLEEVGECVDVCVTFPLLWLTWFSYQRWLACITYRLNKSTLYLALVDIFCAVFAREHTRDS